MSSVALAITAAPLPENGLTSTIVAEIAITATTGSTPSDEPWISGTASG